MKATRVLVVLAAMLAGCAPQAPAPTMPPIPPLTTNEAKECARMCQAIYAQCTGPCGQMILHPMAEGMRVGCNNRCIQTLADCYSTCK